MNIINVKLCMMVVLIKLYPFIPLIYFDGISRSQQCQTVLTENYVLIQFKLTPYTNVDYVRLIEHELCNSGVCLREIIYMVLINQVSGLVKSIKLGFSQTPSMY